MRELWADLSLWTSLSLFLLYVVVDLLYAMYTLSVTKLKPARAATIGAGMYVLLAYGVISYSHNILYLVPIGAGSWIGTYLAVWWERRETKGKV